MVLPVAVLVSSAAAAESEPISVRAFFEATVRVPVGARVEDSPGLLAIVDGERVIFVERAAGWTCGEDPESAQPAPRAPPTGFAYWTEPGGSAWSTCADVPGGVLEVSSLHAPPPAAVLDVLLADLLAAQRAAPPLVGVPSVEVTQFFPHATLRLPPTLDSVEDSPERLRLFEGDAAVGQITRHAGTTCDGLNPLPDEPDLVPPSRVVPSGYATWAETASALWMTCADVPGGTLVVLGRGRWGDPPQLDVFLGDVLEAERASAPQVARAPEVPRPAPPHEPKRLRQVDPALGVRAASAFARLPGLGGMDTPLAAGVGANWLGFVRGQPLFGAAEVAVGYGGGVVFDAGGDFGPMFWVSEVFVGSYVGLHADATIGRVPFGLRAPIGLAAGRLSNDGVSVVAAIEGDWVFASDAARAVPEAALGWDESTLSLAIALPGSRNVVFGVERRHVVQGSAWTLTIGIGQVGGRD